MAELARIRAAITVWLAILNNFPPGPENRTSVDYAPEWPETLHPRAEFQ
jgi:hypothetical protein